MQAPVEQGPQLLAQVAADAKRDHEVDVDGHTGHGMASGRDDGSDSTAFLQQMESPPSGQDEDLSAEQVLSLQQQVYDEGQGDFGLSDEAAAVNGGQPSAAPLRRAELELITNANKQVRCPTLAMLTSILHRNSP